MFAAGVVVGGGVAAAVLAGGPVVSAEAGAGAVQAGVKYDSKVVLENDMVRVKDVTFPVGVADTGMHTHDLAHVGVILTAGALTFVDPDGKKETVQFEAGTVGFREANARHMVANPGKTPMRVIEVEIKR
jgi:mannose-6-phosphate isomerase-like protein (cupin superfamily)